MAEISTIARPYAVAIFNLAKEEKNLSDWSNMLSLLTNIVENEDMKSFIQDSKVLDSDREKVLLEICGDQINNLGNNFIKLLIEYKRLLILPEITSVFEDLKANDEGSIEAQIIMADEPDEKMVENLIKSLEKRFNKKIEGKVEIDKSIVGGTKIIVGDSVIDASIKGQLDNLAYTLKA
tara:strand:- start:214 stop:750 length:537 start_codon:yes stop_codon:yes gene_type:complete